MHEDVSTILQGIRDEAIGGWEELQEIFVVGVINVNL